MVSIYVIISSVIVFLLNHFFDLFKQSYSWWLTPVLILGITFFLILVQIATLLLMILFTDRSKSADKSYHFFHFLLNASLPIILFFAGVKLKTENTDKLPKDSRFLLLCNHQHDYDPIIIMSAFLGAQIGFIGKKEILTEKVFISKAMHRLHSLFIDRENDREAAKTIIQAIKLIKDDKCSVALFPEGRTSPDDVLLPFRNGSLKIALKAKVPIVICAINNTKTVGKSIFRKKSVAQLRLVEVLPFESFQDMNTMELGNLIHEKMGTALDELKNNP